MSLLKRAPFALISSLRLSSVRYLHSSTAILQEKSTNSSSLFGEITQVNDQKATKQEADFSENLQTVGVRVKRKNITLKNDTKLQEYIAPKPVSAAESLLSPLKKQLFEKNVATYGFFKNNQEITLPNGEVYRLKLTREEIDALEPSMYIKSYRLKSSWKKATIFLRFIRGMNVNEAVTQAQFQKKKIGREVAEMLQDRIEDAHQLNLDPNDLYISQIWCGSDGDWTKRIDAKARGKTGIIYHPFIHVRGILKTSITKKRLDWEKEQKHLNKKPVFQLPNEKLRFKLEGHYNW